MGDHQLEQLRHPARRMAHPAERIGVMANRRLEAWASPGAIRLWDGDHQLVHSLSSNELSTDGGARVAETPADEPFAMWLLGAFEPSAYMTVDGPEGRWYGGLDSFSVDRTEQGKTTLRTVWKQIP